MKKYLINSPYIGVGMLTQLKDITDYNSEAMDLRWQLRFFESEREVVGTPYLYYAEKLRRYMFTEGEQMSICDDTDLGKRIKEAGERIGYSNIYCYELGQSTEAAIEKRFKWYGEADYQFYVANAPYWTKERKAFSRGHAWRVEYEQVMQKMVDPAQREKFEPFFRKIAQYRIEGWKKAEKEAAGRTKNT